MLEKKNITKFKLINLFNSKFYFNYAEDVRKCYNLNVKYGLTNSNNLVLKKQHMKWLEYQKKKNSKIFIVHELNKKFMGYIRAEKIRKYYLISISLKHKYKKKNIGTTVLKKFLNKFKFQNFSFLAVVKKNNLNSVNFFIKNNFKIVNIVPFKKNELSKNFYLKFNKYS